jgi:hypothetical protein
MATLPVEYTQRALEQRASALKKAQEVRARRAALKKSWKAQGRRAGLEAARLVEEPPDWLHTQPVAEFIGSLPHMGKPARVRDRRLHGKPNWAWWMDEVGFTSHTTLASMTTRQRRELAFLLRRWSDAVGWTEFLTRRRQP